MVNALAPGLKMISERSTYSTEMSVTVETSKVAISEEPLGTVAGVQFEAVYQSLLVGLRFHVALPAKAKDEVRMKKAERRSLTVFTSAFLGEKQARSKAKTLLLWLKSVSPTTKSLATR